MAAGIVSGTALPVSRKNHYAYNAQQDLLITAINQAGHFTFRTTVGNSIRESFTKEVGASGNPIVPVYNVAFSRRYSLWVGKIIAQPFYSLFGTAGIGYRDRVFVELVARNDWDSKRAA